jgi:hypothetical protein
MSHVQAPEDYRVNRMGWEPGPWDDEPDRVQFKTTAGLVGLVVRSALTGALCGYVGVPPGHPLHGKKYGEIEGVSVHGGLTYSERCDDGPICHVAEPGEPAAVWWIGFDCGHAFDLMPALMAQIARHGLHWGHPDEYRPLAYVRAEVERLAEQVAAIRPG